jgi:prepilin-type N-terminal cleavage/methylation domain-containing protein
MTGLAKQRGGAARGFTLLEVMIGLALLGLGLAVLVKSTAGNIQSARQAHMMGVVTDLSRAKMYEIEEKLMKDGFTDTEQHEDDEPFDDEGWPSIHYSYKIEPVELPSLAQLQDLGKASAAGSGSGAGSDGESPANSFANSALGGAMSSIFGGGGTGSASPDVGAAAGASFVEGQYTMFQQILKESIRKVSLTVTWQVMGRDFDLKTVTFFTDPAAMDKVISGMGAQDLDDAPGGSGSGGGGGGGGGGRGSGGGGRGSGSGVIR